MTASTQSSLLDNQLNESLLIKDERINTHHTADFSEHDGALLQRFSRNNDSIEQIKIRNENEIYSGLQLNKQQEKNGLIYSKVPYYILDEEIQLVTLNAETSIQKLENKNEHKNCLPIYQYHTMLMDAIRDHQVLIIQGEAGSGKTTQLPQYLYEYEKIKCDDTKNPNRRQMIIGCTQPHPISTISLAAYVAKEMNVKLGNEVGYSTHFQTCLSNQTVIKYITDQMLLKEFSTESDLASYSVLIIDQADERTIYTDILFGLVKDILRIRPDFKLLISLTTTSEAMKLSQFFNDAPIFTIPGRRFPVDIYYTKVPEMNYIHAAVQTIIQIHTTQSPGDILVFLTSQEEIEIVFDMLYQELSKLNINDKEFIILPIYSKLSSDIQTRISEPIPVNARRVVLVANIAETSLNINSIRYVIDSGFCKQKLFNPSNGIESLMIQPISKLLANQRAEQAGRIVPGKCFRLYTVETYQNELNDNNIPEIQRINLANAILILKSLGVNDPYTFNYMDSPSLDKLNLAFKQLHAFGALNDRNETTEIGRRMAELSLDPLISKTILASEIYKCSTEILTIISMLFISNSILNQSKNLISSDGDHLTLLNIYNQWKNANYSREWCLENFIPFQSMEHARQIRDQLEHLIKHVGIEMHSNPTDSISIRKAICAGFFYHTAICVGNGIYKTLYHQRNLYMDLNSCLFDQMPSYVIYFEVISTTKEYMRQIIRIEKEWLDEMNELNVRD